MLQRLTLIALAVGAETGTPQGASLAARRFDPLLRPWVRLRIASAVRRAQHMTQDPDRQLKIAFLLEHPTARDRMGQLDGSHMDPLFAEFAGGFAEARAPRWWLSLVVFLLSLGVALAAGAIGLFFWWKPTPEEAFRRTPFGLSLARPFTEFVVDASKKGKAARIENVITPDVERQIGPKASSAYRDVLAGMVRVERSTDDYDATTKGFFASIEQFHNEIDSQHMPAHLYAYVEAKSESAGYSVWLVSFYVEKRSELLIEGTSACAVHGRRIDNLNLANTYSVLKPTWSRCSIVSLDVAEEEFVHDYIPAIGRGDAAKLAMRDVWAGDAPAFTEMGKRFGAEIRKEVVAHSPLTPDAATEVADSVKRRNVALLTLRQKGYGVTESHNVMIPPRLIEQLDRIQDPDAIDVVKASHNLKRHQRAVTTALTLLTDQYEQEFPVRVAEEERLKDTPVQALVRANADTAHSRGVVSAELSRIARETTCPALAMWRSVRWLVEGNRSETRAMVVLFDALLTELGLPGASTWWPDNAPMQEVPFLNALTSSMDIPADRRREAARRAYTKLFGREPPAIVRKAP